MGVGSLLVTLGQKRMSISKYTLLRASLVAVKLVTYIPSKWAVS